MLQIIFIIHIVDEKKRELNAFRIKMLLTLRPNTILPSTPY